MVQERLAKVVEGKDLTRIEAFALMDAMMKGKLSSSQMAALLTALKIKRESREELVGFAKAMQEHATTLPSVFPDTVDTCGTGGDGKYTFNISTAAALIATAAGVSIAKHGNRSVSSKSGSADVLEQLGINIYMSTDEAYQLLSETGFCFLFAPLFHESMKHVMPTRKELGFRTCFNLLGPLVNPFQVKVQLVGVYDLELTEVVAEVLKEMGSERVLVVSGRDGLDEISIAGPTRISELIQGEISTYEITPEEIGLTTRPEPEIHSRDVKESARQIHRILTGEGGDAREIVLANAGAVLYVSGKAKSLKEGVQLAAEMIDTGKAKQKLHEVIHYSWEVKKHAYS
ncbi:anthranilate phosphoribosyltransferase [Thermoflavimicrobium daqui]|jgi:anthranilate phosphoribosyltransferase|uniref:Anthranilate phosphoribosyltransferase n=1 Tax=Thermoflavimicrobium daqui TaxID=2137476 RepID=A0A364K2F9_9BACL|nr:anthranilate phosphoribosyltransferase [Thermoflavimicrobium daqui]RAL22620.1 anthranilate phosphoribosyltransferase [Thermoflavimicrobium daqui]